MGIQPFVHSTLWFCSNVRMSLKAMLEAMLDGDDDSAVSGGGDGRRPKSS